MALQEEVAKLRGSKARMIPEHSATENSASNGVAERAIQSVEAQIRVLRSALEARWERTLEDSEAVMHGLHDLID